MLSCERLKCENGSDRMKPLSDLLMLSPRQLSLPRTAPEKMQCIAGLIPQPLPSIQKVAISTVTDELLRRLPSEFENQVGPHICWQETRSACQSLPKILYWMAVRGMFSPCPTADASAFPTSCPSLASLIPHHCLVHRAHGALRPSTTRQHLPSWTSQPPWDASVAHPPLTPPVLLLLLTRRRVRSAVDGVSSAPARGGEVQVLAAGRQEQVRRREVCGCWHVVMARRGGCRGRKSGGVADGPVVRRGADFAGAVRW
ncbi:hypothetical protein M409DRAFT_60321 [Zasmidium cellare ATCC 36951]|uniref:Uncharacterized protein n=1 Tax=Zasmidium cellare ATCC 36951 TaxID=1080233 RepID=A0A6A6C2V2_ZASCE|nr:uncharacterized protein M409DRAFT_60321 [Zasmidium cellare ATCC 36951]KAF2160069.1 hypothetical protein M409DRAFT_60321 [Zasmidium cellare ATCC 36951]